MKTIKYRLLIALFATMVMGLASAHAQGNDPTLRRDVNQLVAELQNAAKAIREMRVAAAESERERIEFIRKFNDELAAQNRAIVALQQQLAASREQVAEQERRNQQMEALIQRHVADLRKLVATESEQRVASDKRIIEQLSDALKKEFSRLQQDINTRPPAGAPGGTAGRIYQVSAGDTLSAIATAFNVSVDDLKRANNLNRDTIFVGQKLKIPER